MNPSRILQAVCVWCAFAVFCASSFIATAQDAADWITHGANTVLGKASEMTAFVVLDDLQTQLQTPAGQQSVAFVREAAFLEVAGDIRAAWAQLAGSLRLEPDAAFRQMLGDRVVFVARDFRQPVAGGWALATRVSIGDVKRIFRSLEPVQRDVVAGRAVFSIERGKIDLTVVSGNGGGDARFVVIGPSSKPGMFAELVRGLDRQTGWAWANSDAPAEDNAEGAPPGGVLAHFSLIAEKEVVAVGWAHGFLWRGVIIVPASDSGVGLGPKPQPRWSPDAMQRVMGEGSMLGLAGSVSAADISSLAFAPFLGLTDDRVRGVLGDLPRRSMLRVDAAPDGSSVMAAACETDATAFAAADGVLADLVGLLTGQPERSPRFGGQVSSAVRRVDLSGPFSDGIGLRLGTPNPSLAWGFREDPSWVAVAVGTGEAAVDRVRHLLGSLESVGDDSGVISGGIADPARLAGALEQAAGLTEPVIVGAGRIAAIRWISLADGPKSVSAGIEIEMREGD